MLQGLNRIHYERFFSLTISPVARQIERKRADEFIGFRDSVQRRKQRVTGVEMRAAGIPGIPAWDPWRWMDRGHEYTDPVQRRCRAAESYSGRELARGEKQAKAVTLLLFTLCHFSLPPLLLSFIPFFSSFASFHHHPLVRWWILIRSWDWFVVRHLYGAWKVCGVKWNRLERDWINFLYTYCICWLGYIEWIVREYIRINFLSVHKEFPLDFDSFLGPALKFWTYRDCELN